MDANAIAPSPIFEIEMILTQLRLGGVRNVLCINNNNIFSFWTDSQPFLFFPVSGEVVFEPLGVVLICSA